MEDCKETKVLKVVDDENDAFIFWFRQDIPLLTDRDMVLKSKAIIDMKKGQHIIYVDSTDEIPYDSGREYVRMPSFSSVWILEWVDREHTMVTFMIDPDLGGGVPKRITNHTIIKTPYRSLKRMMEEVKKHKYIEAAKTSKYNKLVEDAIKAGYLKP
jgi:hypothetical protein